MLQYRNEYKFLCSSKMLESIENGLSALCAHDSHVNSMGRYNIRSLYFDSPNALYYQQTKNGVDNRHKYRIRIYDNSSDFIRLERKESRHCKKRKESCTISKHEYYRIMNELSLDKKEKVLSEFLCEKERLFLEPKVIVEYTRIPFVYPVGNVRITFDYQLTALFPGDLFAKSLPGIDVLPSGSGILEVKYDEVLPGALSSFFNKYDLQAISFSKYVRCCDALNGFIGA